MRVPPGMLPDEKLFVFGSRIESGCLDERGRACPDRQKKPQNLCSRYTQLVGLSAILTASRTRGPSATEPRVALHENADRRRSELELEASPPGSQKSTPEKSDPPRPSVVLGAIDGGAVESGSIIGRMPAETTRQKTSAPPAPLFFFRVPRP